MKTILSVLLFGIFMLSTNAAVPIALWAFPHGQDVTDTVHLGVVAYHQSGVTQVVFQVNGADMVIVETETLNPTTSEMEFVLVLDTANYPDGALILTATVAGGGVSTALPARSVWVANASVNSIYYVATNGVDQISGGSSNTPFATVGYAVGQASGGDEIRVKDGDYLFEISQKNGATRFVLVRADDGATPRFIPPSGALRAGFIHFKGFEFDWSNVETNLPDGGVTGRMVYGWGEPYAWFEECSFHGPVGLYNSYLQAITLYSGVHDVTVERCEFFDLDKATPLPSGSIARGNHIYTITSDAFNFNSDILITGNVIHDISAPYVYIEGTNTEPFNVTGLGLTFVYNEFKQTYTTFPFPDLGSLVTHAAQASAADLANALMADVAFADKLHATSSNGMLRVTARRRNYLQQLYVTNSAVSVLGFTQDSLGNQARGSGQHADVFQTWGTAPNYFQSNVIIRNNRAYEVMAQGILPQVDFSNFAFVNNLIDVSMAGSWMVNFEKKFDYQNIMLVNNTFWGSKNCIILAMTNAPIDFVVANNIFGPRAAIGDQVMSGLTMDYNLFDYYAPHNGQGPAANSLWTNPEKNWPTPTPLFDLVTSYYDPGDGITELNDYQYSAPDGDFSLSSDSAARDVGNSTLGIHYDIEWNPRAGTPDMGSYEFTVPGADLDSDGMPDNWEVWNGFDPDNADDAQQDADADRAGNYEEYLAGTNPRSMNSLFLTTLTSISSAGIDLSFSTETNRFYSAERCDDLVASNWLAFAENIAGTGASMYISDTNFTDQSFYRMRVRLP